MVRARAVRRQRERHRQRQRQAVLGEKRRYITPIISVISTVLCSAASRLARVR
jgi:hypothetical protein